MDNPRIKIIGIWSAAILMTGVVVLLIMSNRGPKPGGRPEKAVLDIVQTYVQAREDAIGADMASPTTWLDSIKPIVTSAWLNTLQPSENASTGNVPFDFVTAHQNSYVVKASLSNCSWDSILQKPSGDRGLVVCNLNDKTINRTTGAEINASNLPFGWSFTGKQTPVQISVVKQNDKWLVDGDSTGQAQ